MFLSRPPPLSVTPHLSRSPSPPEWSRPACAHFFLSCPPPPPPPLSPACPCNSLFPTMYRPSPTSVYLPCGCLLVHFFDLVVGAHLPHYQGLRFSYSYALGSPQAWRGGARIAGRPAAPSVEAVKAPLARRRESLSTASWGCPVRPRQQAPCSLSTASLGGCSRLSRR